MSSLSKILLDDDLDRSIKEETMAETWIAGMHMNKGALHRALHVPEGKKIPAKLKAKARHSKNPRIRKMAALAKTLGSFHK